MNTFLYYLGRPALRKRPYIDSRDLHEEPLVITHPKKRTTLM